MATSPLSATFQARFTRLDSLFPGGVRGEQSSSAGAILFKDQNVSRKRDATGEWHGKLIMDCRVGICKNGSKQSQSLWRALCECGGEIVGPLSAFRNGKINSCGCIKNIYKTTKRNETVKKNGATVGGKTVTEYNTWKAMRSRCLNMKHAGFKNYGGRGISVCSRWLNSFKNFISDMGKKPGPLYSIDRINNDGNYEPNNCRWASPLQQALNRERKSV